MKAGFIGLGDMGSGIVRRLARSGFALTGCDVSDQVLATFDEPGVTLTADAMDAARDADMLGICVRTDDQLRSVLGDGRLFAAMAHGGLVMLHSTVSPDLARELAATAREHGVGLVDVGVSGGSVAALAGTLALFVGAGPDDLERARPWLDAIGKVFPLGGPGRGQEGKLLNNLVSIANYGAALAILDMADALGIDRAEILAAFEAGSAQSYALRVAPGFVRARGDVPDPAAQIRDLHDLLAKDLHHGVDLPADAPVARATMLAAGEVLLARLRRAAAEVAGHRPPRSADAVADAYFAAVLGRNLEDLIALFAEDAVLAFPTGQVFNGREAIRDCYTRAFSGGWPSPAPGRRLSSHDGVAVEVAALAPSGATVRTCNVYRCG
ncbi:MAG TPA: NAD(P)-binding domain-containing protein, partial [Novosphingobium sp.]|nr:NAD(P)-binding domain-containing protein [Novosphingobium sp.]